MAKENYSCAADNYSFKECKFEVPKINHGNTKLIKVNNGVFSGNALILCNNGKRSIISESCDYIQGEADSCKGVPANTWTGVGNSICNHSSISVSIANGDEYKVSSLKDNGFVKYECINSELKIKSSDCVRPESGGKITTASIGVQCVSKVYKGEAVYDYVNKTWGSVPPNDSYCINEGFDYLDSYVDISSNNDLNLDKVSHFNAVCCSNDVLVSPNTEITVTPITGDCATVDGVIAGDINEITGLASNTPSRYKVLNAMCKPNGYSKLTNFTTKNVIVGGYTYTDEFRVSANCCGNNAIANDNTACKGAFISSGLFAEDEAKSLGIPFLCDSSTGLTECYKNTCTPFVSDSELCAECNLGNYSFNANANRCTVDFPVILTGHENIKEFFNDTHSGYADISCNNGSESVDDARCFNNCLNKRVTWENDSKTAVCYYDLPKSKYRHYLELSDNDRTNPHMEVGDKTDRIISVSHTGVAEFHCDDGNWVENSEDLSKPLCFASCDAKTASWGKGISKDGRDKVNACKAQLPSKRHFKQPKFNSADGVDPMKDATEDPLLSVTTANTFGLNNGTAQFRCNDGNWESNGAEVCNLDCSAQTVSWTENGATASASVAANKHGTTLYNVVATNGVNIGKAENNRLTSSVTNLVCDDGRYIPVSPAVVAEDCKAGTMSFDSANLSNACSFTWGTLRHTNTGTLSASGLGTGSVNYSCQDGQMKFDANSLVCNASCPSGKVEWARTSGLSSDCLTGFVKNGSVCQRETIVNPTCLNGKTFNPATDQCEVNVVVTDSYPSVASCDGVYSGYLENGFKCEKTYTAQPKCPIGQVYNGSQCTSVSGFNVDEGTWVCPSGYTYHSTYSSSVTSSKVCTKQVILSVAPIEVCSTGSKITNYSLCSNNGINAASCCMSVEMEDAACSPDEYIGGCNNFVKTYYPLVKKCTTGTYNSANNKCVTEEVVACPSITTNYNNVCVKSASVTPKCATGYVFKSSTGLCETNTITSGELSCPAQGKLTEPARVPIYTREVQIQRACERDAIDGFCCLISENRCTSNRDEANRICDWLSVTPAIKCPTGTTLNGTTCLIKSSKAATCDIGYERVVNSCIKKEIIDASLKCNDGTSAPCNNPVTSSAVCDPIRLDTGSLVTPALVPPFCKYTHSVSNVATRTCPSGGSPIGNTCYIQVSKLEIEIPTCSNGGTLNKVTNKCVAIETRAPRSFEPVNCSANVSSAIHSVGGISVVDNKQDGATGSATMSCVDGNWVSTMSFCAQDCSPMITAATNSMGTLEWKTGDILASNHSAYGLNCVTDPIPMVNYSHSSQSNGNKTKSNGVKLVGSISYQCVDGRWDVTNASCSRVSCSANNASFTGQSVCNIRTPAMKWGDKATVNQPAGFSGATDAVYSCGDSGSSTLSNNPDCNADCNVASSVNSYLWNDSVSGCTQVSNGYLDHNEIITIKDQSGSTRGSVGLSCKNGVISKTGELCKNVSTTGASVKWDSTNNTNGLAGNCTGKLPNDIMVGGTNFGATECVTVANTNSLYVGTATICATNTGLIKTSGSCSAVNENKCVTIVGLARNTCLTGDKLVTNSSNCTANGLDRDACCRSTMVDGGSLNMTYYAVTKLCLTGELQGNNCVLPDTNVIFAPNECEAGFTYNGISHMCETKSGNQNWSEVKIASKFEVCNVPTGRNVGVVKTGSCSIGDTNYVKKCTGLCQSPFNAGLYTFCEDTTQTCIVSPTQSMVPTCPKASQMIEGNKCQKICSILVSTGDF